jgi:type I restriction enzyme M protein
MYVCAGYIMFEQAFKNIDDVLWKEAGCTTELDYTEQTSWLLFLKYLNDLEEDRADVAALENRRYTYILDKPYRWESWAAPKAKDGKLDHNTAKTGDDLPTSSTASSYPTSTPSSRRPAVPTPSNTKSGKSSARPESYYYVAAAVASRARGHFPKTPSRPLMYAGR